MDSSHLCFLEDSFNFVPLTGECYQRQIFIDCLLDASWEPPLMGWNIDHICSSFVMLSELLAYGPGCTVPLACLEEGKQRSWVSQLATNHQPQYPFLPYHVCPDMWGRWRGTWGASRVEWPLVAHSWVRLSWEPQVAASTWVGNINFGDTAAVCVLWTLQRTVNSQKVQRRKGHLSAVLTCRLREPGGIF